MTASPVRASETSVIGSDYRGTLAVNNGIVFYLTPCCKASVKGSVNSPTGVCCRACYAPVPEALGAGWFAYDEAAWSRYGEDLYTAAVADGARDNASNREVMLRAASRARAAAVAS